MLISLGSDGWCAKRGTKRGRGARECGTTRVISTSQIHIHLYFYKSSNRSRKSHISPSYSPLSYPPYHIHFPIHKLAFIFQSHNITNWAISSQVKSSHGMRRIQGLQQIKVGLWMHVCIEGVWEKEVVGMLVHVSMIGRLCDRLYDTTSSIQPPAAPASAPAPFNPWR